MKWNLDKFLEDNRANMNLILTAVMIAIVLAISVIIVFNVIGTVDATTIDADFSGTPAKNSSDDLLTNVQTFYTVAPIILIVVAAVGILSYILMLRGG